MNKGHFILAFIFFTNLFAASSCVYRPTVQQGNILTEKETRSIHVGMTRNEVISRLGQPVLKNIYYNDRLYYVYTVQPNRKSMKKRQLDIWFKSGRVTHYSIYSS